MLLANLITAAGVFLTFGTGPGAVTPTLRPYRELVITNVAALGVYLLFLVMPGTWAIVRSRLRPAVRWIDERRAPTRHERALLFSQPWRLAVWNLLAWAGALVWIPVLNMTRFYGPGDYPIVRGQLGLLLAALFAGSIVYLLVEGRLRGVFALALVQESDVEPNAVGVLPRLVSTWAVGSGLLFVAAILAFAGLDDPAEYEEARLTLWVLSSLGIIVGLSTMIAAARSLTGRLRTIQDGLARVEEGDLDVAIGVDDAGELGQLQRGFDRMVAGLRERRDLENLFGRHVGVDVARQALARGPSLGGEQREASALFVDVIGSARLALERSPTDVVSLLNDFFAAVVEVATAHGGWVNKFEGDGALCVFGVLSETPEHSAAALRASRVLRSRLDVLAQAHPGLDAAIGVASGTVVAGNVGAEERYEYTVIGEPVNAASRLTEEAKNHASRLVAAAVSVETAGEESRHWRSPGAVTLRGWGEPTKICEPV